ncbi:squalene/phytoene synthase family protein [Sphingomonas sp.]|jgi:phytoene synthase|uniref:squalene/phytoene synthase family protein n=1 Tax=Sphingomonas sp. TaxID=28214 RepID=UPI002ED7B1C1
MPRDHADRLLAIGYAPADARAALTALFELDAALGAILRTTREPLLGQMRLTWWHEALVALDGGAAPAHPVLRDLGRDVVPRVSGAMLAAMVDGWEALLDDPLDAGAMERFAAMRGGGMFVAAGAVLGIEREGLQEAGAGWALADLAGNLGDPASGTLARTLALPRLAAAMRTAWPHRGRALGALVLLARDGRSGSPALAARLMWHRATGL